MLRAARIDCPDVELARIVACRRYDVGQRAIGRGGVSRQEELEGADFRHGGEVGYRIERQILEESDADRRAVGEQRKRVSVGWRGKYGAGRGYPPATGIVFHDHTLPELVAELLGNESRGRVPDTARPERNDQTKWPIGVACLPPRLV